jgi:hypothetical protein
MTKTRPDPVGETIPPGEAEAVRCVVAQFRAKHDVENADTLPALRGQHAKSHGCVRADFVVADGLPEFLRKGLFAHANARYQAWIRFSAAAARPRPDTKREAQGMAIKVMVPVERENPWKSQDFILSNHPVFPIKNTVEYCPFAEALAARSWKARLRKYLELVLPPNSHLRGFAILFRINVKRPITNPLTTRYWSQTPYRFGDDAVVKYAARPHPPSLPERALSPDNPVVARPANLLAMLIGSPARNDFLEDAMARRLSPGAPTARFDFQVQLYKDEHTTPADDPRIEWDERESPCHTVATIEIPAQEFTSQRHRNAVEALSFTPRHALPEHTPLGSINRVRCAVYDSISARRHEINGTSRREPTPDDGWLGEGTIVPEYTARPED